MSAKRIKREAADAVGPSNRAPDEPVVPKIAMPRGALTSMNAKVPTTVLQAAVLVDHAGMSHAVW